MGVSYRETGRGVVRKKRVVVGWRRGVQRFGRLRQPGDVGVDDGVRVCGSSVYGVDAGVGAASVWAPWDCRVPRRSDDCLFEAFSGLGKHGPCRCLRWRRALVGVGVNLIVAAIIVYELFPNVCSYRIWKRMIKIFPLTG